MIWTEITLNKSPSNRAWGGESQMGSILYQIQREWKVLGSGEQISPFSWYSEGIFMIPFNSEPVPLASISKKSVSREKTAPALSPHLFLLPISLFLCFSSVALARVFSTIYLFMLQENKLCIPPHHLVVPLFHLKTQPDTGKVLEFTQPVTWWNANSFLWY